MARSKLQTKLAEKQAKEAEIQQQLSLAAKHPHKSKAKRDKLLSLSDILKYLKMGPLESLSSYPTVRSFDTFKSKSCNSSRQINEFIKHVFCRYPVPRFMFGVWHLGSEEKFRPWFICLAQGGSLYKEHTKTVMSKAETADFVRNSDNRLGIEQNIWRAKLKAMGANDECAYSIVTSRFCEVASVALKFWTDVARFFVNNKVPKNDMDEILDFLRNKYREDENFSLKGRTLASITKLSNEWHEEQVRKQSTYGKVWEGMHLEPWTYTTKFNHPYNKTRVSKVYTIEEITDSKSLFAEGRQQGHCVGSYVRDCELGHSSIFKMESVDEINGFQKHLTIQVNIKSKRVVQARGKYNAKPTTTQQAVLDAWRQKHNLIESRGWW